MSPLSCFYIYFILVEHVGVGWRKNCIYRKDISIKLNMSQTEAKIQGLAVGK